MSFVGDLDTDITNVFTLLAVLLVFVFAFFSSVWARVEEFLDQNPTEDIDKGRLKTRLKNQRRLVITLIFAVVALGALVSPLSDRVLNAWQWQPFDTVRGGLLLLDVFVILMVVIAGWLWHRLNKKIGAM